MKIFKEVWESNKNRMNGRFNYIMFWVYILVAPTLMVWGFLEWFEGLFTTNVEDRAV
jgi:hypothetical protein